MGDAIDELLSRDDVHPAGPASQADIVALSERINAPLPDALLKLWRASAGVTFDPIEANLLGPTEALQLITDDAWQRQYAERGLVPVLDDHESNLLAVVVREPLAFRIVHMPHDDGGRLLYRDFESCVRALIGAADRGETADLFFFETEGDYPPDTPRSPEDQSAAKVLLAGKHELDEWNHAARLLDAGNLDEWAKLLETDHFVRRDARSRMKKMRSPAIRELLRKDEQAFEDFTSKIIEAMRGAGLKVGDRNGTCVRVGMSWYELEAFFFRRNIPDAMPRMVLWIQDQMAGRHPRDRVRNFMSD